MVHDLVTKQLSRERGVSSAGWEGEKRKLRAVAYLVHLFQGLAAGLGITEEQDHCRQKIRGHEEEVEVTEDAGVEKGVEKVKQDGKATQDDPSEGAKLRIKH